MKTTHSARGVNRTGHRPAPTRQQAAGPTTMLIPPWTPAFSAASYAQELQALGEQCASIVVRPETHYFLRCSTPNIVKPNFFIVCFYEKHTIRARGNRTGYMFLQLTRHPPPKLFWFLKKRFGIASKTCFSQFGDQLARIPENGSCPKSRWPHNEKYLDGREQNKNKISRLGQR